MDKPSIGHNSLENLTKLFSRFGWHKKLNEITKGEILATIVVMQFSKRVEEDEQFTREQLNKLLIEYVKDYDEQSVEKQQDII